MTSWKVFERFDEAALPLGLMMDLVNGLVLIVIGVGVAAMSALAAAFKQEYEHRINQHRKAGCDDHLNDI